MMHLHTALWDLVVYVFSFSLKSIVLIDNETKSSFKQKLRCTLIVQPIQVRIMYMYLSWIFFPMWRELSFLWQRPHNFYFAVFFLYYFSNLFISNVLLCPAPSVIWLYEWQQFYSCLPLACLAVIVTKYCCSFFLYNYHWCGILTLKSYPMWFFSSLTGFIYDKPLFFKGVRLCLRSQWKSIWHISIW